MTFPAVVEARTDSLSTRGEPLSRAFGWVVAYVLLTWCTGAYFMADTMVYVSSVCAHDQGINYIFWDFRHLFWRPLGWVFLHLLSPVLTPAMKNEPRITVTYIFLAISWVAGLLSIFLLRAFLRRFCSQTWAIEFSTIAFVFSLAFLNYIHSGTPYILGLAFLLLGFYLVSRITEPGSSKYLEYCAPVSLAASVCLWFPFAFAIPGALALPFFYPDRSFRRRPLVLRMTAICLLIGIFAYGWVLLHQGIYTVPGALRWIGQGATSVAGVRGFNRTVFGFAHSFVDLGKDGVLFKRFLTHDPYNPVSLSQLLRASLYKLALFYAVLLAIVVQLARSGKTNILAICGLSAGPVLIFALLWFGGDIERYLPLYPVFFLALCCAIAEDRRGLTRALAAVFVIVAITGSYLALSQRTLQHQQQVIVDRVQDLLPLLKPASRVIEVDIHDDLVNFPLSFPLHPINRKSPILNDPLLNPGTPQVLHWRQHFATAVLDTWKAQGDVWISERVLASRPDANWGWIEKGDPNVNWQDLHALFSQFDFGAVIGGNDGFLPLLPTQKNQAILDSLQSKR